METTLIYDYIDAFTYAETATMIHVASDAIRENISFNKAYENLAAHIEAIHDDEGFGMLLEIADVEDARKLNNLIIIGAMKLQNMMKQLELAGTELCKKG